MPLVGNEKGTAFETLLQQIVADGMVVRRVLVAVPEAVFFKSLIEAYPGLAALHAERTIKTAASPVAESPVAEKRAQLVVATTPGFEMELDELLHELSQEMDLTLATNPALTPSS